MKQEPKRLYNPGIFLIGILLSLCCAAGVAALAIAMINISMGNIAASMEIVGIPIIVILVSAWLGHLAFTSSVKVVDNDSELEDWDE